MNKAEYTAHLKKLRRLDESILPTAGGTIPSTKQDMIDELGRMDTFREFARDNESRKGKLNSDEC